MVAGFGEGFTGEFEEESSTGLPSEASALEGLGAQESGGGIRRKLQGRRTGDWVLGFFGSRLFRHEDVLKQIPSHGNEKLQLGRDGRRLGGGRPHSRHRGNGLRGRPSCVPTEA